MSEPSVLNITALNNRALKAAKERSKLASFLTVDKAPSRIAQALALELSDHLFATAKTILDLTPKLASWAHDHLDRGDDRRKRLTQFSFRLAFENLERCVEVLEINHKAQLLDLSKTIVLKTLELTPIGSIRLLSQVIQGIEECIDHLHSGPSRNLEITRVTLSELELLATMALASAELASMSVHAITKASDVDSFQKPLEELARAEKNRARTEITNTLLAIREESEHLFADEKLPWLFPRDGLWPEEWMRIKSLEEPAA